MQGRQGCPHPRLWHLRPLCGRCGLIVCCAFLSGTASVHGHVKTLGSRRGALFAPEVPFTENAGGVSVALSRSAMVTFSGARPLLFGTGSMRMRLAGPRKVLLTANTPWRGVYWPEIRQARLGAQLAPQA